MKRFYQFFLTLLLCMTGVAAHADDVKVTIKVDDASRVGIQVNYAEQDVVAGKNEFTVPQYTFVRVYAKAGALIKNVKDDTSGYDVMSRIGTEYTTYPSADVTYSVTSVSEDAIYTKSFTVNVDDPVGVDAMLSNSYRSLSLVQGENTVKYNPETENSLSIRKGYGKPLYKVTKDGADVAAQGQGFTLDITEGMVVDVTAEWPADVKYTVTFNWGNEDSKGYIQKVQVDGVDMPLADEMEIAGGSQVSITFNSADYTLESFKVDGVSQNLYGQYNFYITKNTVIDVTAHKAKMLQCTLNIDDPNNVTVYKGYQYENNVLSLVAGDNAIEMSENGNKCVTIVANAQCFVTSINDGTQDLSVSSYGTTVNVTDGMVITVKTGKVVRDKTAKVEVLGRELANYYFNFFSENDRTYSFNFPEEGTHPLFFGDSDLPFNFGCAGSTNPTSTVYVNGLRAHQYYGQYKLYFDEGATITIDLNESRKEFEKTVTVTLGKGTEKSAVQKMETAIGEAYEWDTKGFTSIERADYTVTITPSADADLVVYVDDTQVEKNEQGKFVATITAESNTISITDLAPTAISQVNNVAADGKIYTIAGVQVKKATKGFYIINGKKCLVK